MGKQELRNLVLILGDQLDHDSSVFDDFDKEQDQIWMAEVDEEASHVWAHKLRIAFFFSAMRHFRDWLVERGYPVLYHALSRCRSEDKGGSFAEVLRKDIHQLKPRRVVLVQPGDYRVEQAIRGEVEGLGVELEVQEDRHFYSTPEEFKDFAAGRKTLVMETFYRQMRKRAQVLVTADGKPEGGEWNFDQDNRETFGRKGPPEHKTPRKFSPDAITQEVIELVQKRFKDHPGSLDHFNLPMTRADALAFLREFIEERLPHFGTYQDALWQGEHFLFHSRISALLNVKLLNPREVVHKAVEAYQNCDAPLNAVEGFVRQILGWREFIRGVYWLEMPGYLEQNALGAEAEIPSFFWDGKTQMACVRDAMENVIEHGYAHHIQRLMVLGLFSQIYGVNPKRFHEWHMAMYLDAIDWVSAPNTIGMSQYADGGIVGSKPYCASGNYINKMSNHCKDCRFNPSESTGERACPFTVFYYDFLARHKERFKGNRRMSFQIKNLDRKEAKGDLSPILKQAEQYRQQIVNNS